jgi:hypothetical protein
MVRCVAAVILALTCNPALVLAQDTVLTVTVSSAEVHKGPSIVTPVIGHAAEGTVLPISRNLGSWARVAWPKAPEGIGYVHVTMGRLGPAKAAMPVQPTPSRTLSASATTPSASAPAVLSVPPSAQRPTNERMAIRGELNDTPITHIFGVGGLVASPGSFGGTARFWRTDRVGIQLSFTQDRMTSDVAAGRVTSMRFEPGVVYALFDHVSDYVWMRPYLGSVLSIHRQTLKVPAPAAIEPPSESGFGFRVFGGSELTFAGAPRFGLSLELGYRRSPAPFPDFEAARMSASLAGHWYIK